MGTHLNHLMTLAGAAIVLTSTTAAAQECAGNQAPVIECPAITHLHADWQCSWFIDAWNVDPGLYDPDGDEVHCTFDHQIGHGLGVTEVTMTCSDLCGAQSHCSTLVAPQDTMAPWVEVLDGEATINMTDGYQWNWTHIEHACDFHWADNCTPHGSFVRGIIGVSSDHPAEVFLGEPGAFSSMWAVFDWSGGGFELDRNVAEPRTYTVDYAVVDGYGNMTTRQCSLRVE